MTDRRGLWFLFGLFLILTLAYWGITLYLDGRVETLLSRRFPGQPHVEGIELDLLGPGITLHRLRLGLPPPAPEGSRVSVDELSVDLGIESLWTATTAIDEIVLRRPVVEFSSLSPRVVSHGSSSPTPGSPSQQFGRADLVVESIKLKEGIVRYTPESGPRRELRPVDARVSRIDLRKSNQEISFTVGLPAENRRPVQVRGSLRQVPSQPVLSSTLTLEQAPLSQFNPLLGGSRFSGGNLNGAVKIHYGSGVLRVEPAEKLVLSGGRLKVGGVTVQTGTKERPPDRKSYDAPDGSRTGPAWTTEPIHLELREFGVVFPGGRNLKIDRGILRFGPQQQNSPTAPLVGNLRLAQPGGSLRFASRASSFDEPRGLRTLAALIAIPRVESLNPLVGDKLPFQFSRGALKASLAGRALHSELDLSLDLQFQDLRLDYSSRVDTIVDLPLSLVVDYLKRKDGQLDLSIHVTGTPASPRFNTASIRNKIVMNLGIEAAVLSSVGLPVYLGSKIIEGTTGFSLLGETRSLLGSLFSDEQEGINLADEMEGVNSIPRLESPPGENRSPKQ